MLVFPHVKTIAAGPGKGKELKLKPSRKSTPSGSFHRLPGKDVCGVGCGESPEGNAFWTCMLKHCLDYDFRVEPCDFWNKLSVHWLVLA